MVLTKTNGFDHRMQNTSSLFSTSVISYHKLRVSTESNIFACPTIPPVIRDECDEITITVEGLYRKHTRETVVAELVESASKRAILRTVAREKDDDALDDRGADELREAFNRIAGQKQSRGIEAGHRFVLKELEKLRFGILELGAQVGDLQEA